MNSLIITASGPDRPGIVAAVTGKLYELGANLADCAMARIGGQFTMMLLVQSQAAPDVMRDGLEPAGSTFGLDISVREAQQSEPGPSGRPYVVSVYGADHPGIVHGIAETLAARNVNITDLSSHLMGGVYTMVLDVQVPSELDPAVVEADLMDAAYRLGVNHAFRPADAETL